MPMYVLNRNYLLRSAMGHSIGFEKGVPVNVPTYCEREAVAIGADRVDGGFTDPIPAEKPIAEELGQDERDALIAMAFEDIVKRNDSKEFTGQGVPTAKAVEKIVSFSVERGELATLWARLKEEA